MDYKPGKNFMLSEIDISSGLIKNVIGMYEHIFKNLLKLTSELSVATRITFICPMTFNSFPLDVQVCLFQVVRKRQVQSEKKHDI